MRLLEVKSLRDGSLRTKEFFGRNIPRYAILSHTWGDDEVLFCHLGNVNAVERAGYQKVKCTLEQAERDGFEYAWIDSCCINKDSSAELSEAINSMYSWYQKAAICYVYLFDVLADPQLHGRMPDSFSRSRWFTRGWTLQELLAPSTLSFYDQDWGYLGTKDDLLDEISTASNIPSDYLGGDPQIRVQDASIAKRMSWAAHRITTREEDIAYCLIGIFDVHMPMLYGEGSRAFIRLQEEIMKGSDDQTLFAWRQKDSSRYSQRGLLTDSPRDFEFSGDIVPLRPMNNHGDGHTITNRGLNIHLRLDHLRPIQSDLRGDVLTTFRLGVLECGFESQSGCIAIYLHPTSESGRHFQRVSCYRFCVLEALGTSEQSIYVRQNPVRPPDPYVLREPHHDVQIKVKGPLESRSGIRWYVDGLYLDSLGQPHRYTRKTYDPTTCVKMAKSNGLITAYLPLKGQVYPGRPVAFQFVLLIGTDSFGELALDLWHLPSHGKVDDHLTNLELSIDQGEPPKPLRFHRSLVQACTPKQTGELCKEPPLTVTVVVQPALALGERVIEVTACHSSSIHNSSVSTLTGTTERSLDFCKGSIRKEISLGKDTKGWVKHIYKLAPALATDHT